MPHYLFCLYIHVSLYTCLSFYILNKDCRGRDITRYFYCWIFGTSLGNINFNESEERAVVGAVAKMWVFRRAIINDLEFQSSLYKRSTARNNFTESLWFNFKICQVCPKVCENVMCTITWKMFVQFATVFRCFSKENGKAHLSTFNISRYESSRVSQTGDHSRQHHCCASYIHQRKMYED